MSNVGAIALYEGFGFRPKGVRRGYYTDNREDALIMWRDPDPADPADEEGRRLNVLGIETSCDETAAAVVTGDGAVLSSVAASQAELHARFGGVVPEVASRRHLELVSPVVRAALEDASIGLDDLDRVGVTQALGAVGALLVGLSAAKAIAWARGLLLVPVDHLQGRTSRRSTSVLDPLEPPFTCLLASGGHTLVLSVRNRNGFEVLASTLTTRPVRRSTRAPGCSASGAPAGPRSTGSPARATPRRSGSRSRAGAWSRLLVLRAEDRSALRGARASPRRSLPRAAPISRRRTSVRSSRRSSAGSEREPSARQTGRSPSSAALPPTRSSAPPCRMHASPCSRSPRTTPP